MKRTLQLILIGAWTMVLAGTAAALPPPGGEEPPPEEEPPPPPPSQPTYFSFVAQRTGSIGNSTLGANYQAHLTAWTDSNRQSFGARGYAWSDATLLGLRKNLVIINGSATAGTSFGTEISMFLLGQQMFNYKDSFSTSFSKTFSALDRRYEFWSYTNSWSFLGSGVTIRLGLDGGVTMGGTVTGQPRRISADLNPRVWVDAGGALSFHLLWITAGSLSGSIHLVDAQGWGTAAIDATQFPYGPTYWTVSGWGRLCTGGGAITGCALGKCGTLVSWNNYCPGWLTLSGSASGSF